MKNLALFPTPLLSHMNIHRTEPLLAGPQSEPPQKVSLGTTFQTSSWYLHRAPTPGQEGLQISPRQGPAAAPHCREAKHLGACTIFNIAFLPLMCLISLGK